ncbi:hypothetical protein PGLA_09580 [Paenibacillus glacialis]|uniref:Uncharacterized protein n=1 Tax=Paenibacillus glacialis TaxID=494026 RepID=A0A168LDH0_9BACL|nr:hypothetical protein PGLA_09580 [Paenibacillus glacialis]
MVFTALWTHGNAVVPESPEQLDQFTRYGFGTQVQTKTGTNHWFHVPMPSPVLTGTYRPKLLRVFILSNSDISSCISKVHIYDGSRLVTERNPLICGNKLTIQNDNAIHFATPPSGPGGIIPAFPGLPIYYGLGITMLIDAGTFPKRFFFAAFGADWE